MMTAMMIMTVMMAMTVMMVMTVITVMLYSNGAHTNDQTSFDDRHDWLLISS